ncbi:hypothetical protein FEM48_Zijuj02G0180300 [Ziziphus jujuba var. spinosa]|uniref:Tryptophanyl-tRNA synthetase n=1 Tax=Ziziphus jujuba var. spinosa TaxID=714518 RepID=A0A978VX58_ZIZJJ|nr:hypothetical protein FEM48_Zijuj02G0180300 [Ziziphus jujuba var. spinosa]
MEKREVAEQEREQEQVVTPWKLCRAKTDRGLTTTSSLSSSVARGWTSPLSTAFSFLPIDLPTSSSDVEFSLLTGTSISFLMPMRKETSFISKTRRGPSSEALRLGHLIPFMFTKYLQDAFKVPLVIQLTDDEKCMWKDLSVEGSQRFPRENAKDIIACGFAVTRTFIFSFSDFDYMGGLYEIFRAGLSRRTLQRFQSVSHVIRLRVFLVSRVKIILEKCFFLLFRYSEHNMNCDLQAASSFPSSFPHLFNGRDQLRCLIPCAIDQDPNFRMTQDVAPRIGYHKPALIESSFFPALQNRINKYAFSGGQDSIEKHRQLGANLEVDIPVKYLSFFHDDDVEIEHIKKVEVKKRLIEILTELVERHLRSRAAVTDEMVDAFMEVRPLPSMFN